MDLLSAINQWFSTYTVTLHSFAYQMFSYYHIQLIFAKHETYYYSAYLADKTLLSNKFSNVTSSGVQFIACKRHKA